jgi:hypothetical protein
MSRRHSGVSTAARKKAFLQAMHKTNGNVTMSAKTADISRQLIYAWKDKDPKFKAEFESNQFEETYKDQIEAKLMKLGLQDENPTILIFLAKTKCKDRGYIERTELKVDKETIIKVDYFDPEEEQPGEDD